MFSFDLHLALLSHILSLRMYALLHGVIAWGKCVLYCIQYSIASGKFDDERCAIFLFERTRKLDFVFQTLLDQGLRANYHIYFTNTPTPFCKRHWQLKTGQPNQSNGK